MELPDNSLDQTYANSSEGSSLESQALPVTSVEFTQAKIPLSRVPFGYNRTALWITAAAFIIFFLILIVSGILSVAHRGKTIS